MVLHRYITVTSFTVICLWPVETCSFQFLVGNIGMLQCSVIYCIIHMLEGRMNIYICNKVDRFFDYSNNIDYNMNAPF